MSNTDTLFKLNDLELKLIKLIENLDKSISDRLSKLDERIKSLEKKGDSHSPSLVCSFCTNVVSILCKRCGKELCMKHTFICTKCDGKFCINCGGVSTYDKFYCTTHYYSS